ncbi:MAG TPA: class I SAM-dependent methyltransferase [Nocardioidaceae bacterium]|nr:class I SAM-dependent methyltransferase [Nocardioidaceae bacterium]
MATTPTGTPTPEYVLGHDRAEIARLEQQAAVLAPHSRVILERAGLGPGMRVLDVGAGVGDVAFLAADLVGPEGSVVGLDRSELALARARDRAGERGLTNIEFRSGELQGWRPDEVFDVVIGRLILLYVDDPVVTVRAVADLVRPDGVVAFMEYDMAAVRSIPPLPLVEQVRGWVLDGFTGSGHDPELGVRLAAILSEAGLRDVGSVGLQTYLPPGSPIGPAMAAGVIRSLLPALEAHGIATAAEVDIDTLEDRVRNELAGDRTVFAPPALIGAWGTT